MPKKHEADVIVRARGEGGTRVIIVDGNDAGTVEKVDKDGDYEEHWAGEMINQRGETWRISEENIRDVRIRAVEACR